MEYVKYYNLLSIYDRDHELIFLYGTRVTLGIKEVLMYLYIYPKKVVKIKKIK